ncbi:MAG: hypothetical protein SFY56_15920 [Bacteroidota bacterium]|nr:hypothetical protein [Bacteroidota bacterium]
MKFFLIFTVPFLFYVPNDLKKLRKEFVLLENSEKAIYEIKKIATSTSEVSLPVKSAYVAVAEMTSAKYKLNPISRLSAFNSGKKLLESAIKADSLNPEIIFIRYTIQTQVPSFLGYSKNISRDQEFLISRLNSIKIDDAELYSTIYNYLIYKGNKK